MNASALHQPARLHIALLYRFLVVCLGRMPRLEVVCAAPRDEPIA